MKYLNKLMSLLMILVLTVGMYGCGIKTPSKAVEETLDSIKSGKNKVFSQVINSKVGGSGKNSDTEQGYSKSMSKFMDSIKKITYKVNSETIDNDTAKVNVTLNGPDFEAVLSQFMEKASTDAISGNAINNEETDAKYDEMLSEALDNAEPCERTMDIELVKDDKGWKIKNENDLLKLVANIDPSVFNNTFD